MARTLPGCGYAKPTLEVAVEQDRIAVSCSACGEVAGIAAVMGVASDIVIASSGEPAKVTRALMPGARQRHRWFFG